MVIEMDGCEFDDILIKVYMMVIGMDVMLINVNMVIKVQKDENGDGCDVDESLTW